MSRAVLDELPILRFLPPDARRVVVGSFVPAAYGFGDAIVREGEAADAFYVLSSGKARVVKEAREGEEISLNVLRAGDSFGEIGLLDGGAVRTATVRASSDVEVLRLDRGVFLALVDMHPEIRSGLELAVKHRGLNTFFHLYTPFAKLPAAALRELLSQFEPVEVKKGDAVIRQGDAPGPLYVVEEGRLRVWTEEDGRRSYVGYLRKGDVFGERSVFLGQPRAATVEAFSDARLLKLPPKAFKKLASEHEGFRKEISERIAQEDYRKTANVPLDFAEELLPAAASVEDVSKEQAEETDRFTTEDGRYRKRRRIRRFPFVHQIDEMDCGVACLAMVCRHFGRAVSLAKLRRLLFTSTDGTSLRAICGGAEGIGLAARAVKTSVRNAAELPLPAILHWDKNHWVVLYDVSDGTARIADPAFGFRRVPLAELEATWSGYAALFDYTAEFEKAPVGRSGAAWLARFFRPHAATLGKALALALVVAALQMVVPVFTQVVVDRVLVENDLGLLNVLLLGMAGVLVFSTLALLVQRYLLAFVAVRVDSASLDFLTRRLLSLPMSYFHTRKTGDIQRRLMGLRNVREFLVQHGVAALTACAQLAAAVALMLVYSPLLALVFLATVPVYAFLMRFSATRLRPIYHELEDAYGKYAGHQIDAIKGMETVKALAAESGLRELMLARFHALAKKQFRADFTVMTYDGAVQTTSFLSMVLFLWAGAHQVLSGALTIGGLVAFSALVALANAPITALLTLWDQGQLARVLLDRMNDVFEEEPEQGADRSRLAPVPTLEGRVRFQNVGFQYGGPESPRILEEITFEAPPGRRVAIVGRSGSGKTTLVKLLCGLVTPTSGSILFDGVDMKTLLFSDLRRRIGFVLQESWLFDDTIARNIAFGDPEPDMDRVLWAARVANAHEFVERLPLGYETWVGESGIAISGGQKQRIAIARAVYNRPPILVFDEATSALDTESERAVKENLDRLLEGRTSFVIAHRLSTIRDADVILVLEKGRLVEQGTHEQLMERQGLYYYLVSQQLGL